MSVKHDEMEYTMQKGYTNLALLGSRSMFGSDFPKSVRNRKGSVGLPITKLLTPRPGFSLRMPALMTRR